MKHQAYEMSMLFDFYGEMLTERQKEFFDLYYNEDLSLAEVAENYGITRQGVRDVIVRAEAIMKEMEAKTGIIARFHKLQNQLTSIDSKMNDILAINQRNYQDDELKNLVMEIKQITETLKQE
jgi:predicted DNA-binding protein YlxM (UPF0122 family)